MRYDRKTHKRHNNRQVTLEKSKITKILNSEKNLKRKVPSQMAKSNWNTSNEWRTSVIFPTWYRHSHMLNMVDLTWFYSAKQCMTVASNSIIFITMREQNRLNRYNCQNRDTAINTVSKSKSKQKQTQISNKEAQKRKFFIICRQKE